MEWLNLDIFKLNAIDGEYVFGRFKPAKILAMDKFEAEMKEADTPADETYARKNHISVMRPYNGVMKPYQTTLRALVGGGMKIRAATHEEFMRDVQNNDDNTFIYWRRFIIGKFYNNIPDEKYLEHTTAVVLKLHDHPILDDEVTAEILDANEIPYLIYSTPFQTDTYTDLVVVIPLSRPVSLSEHNIIAQEIMKILGVELTPQEYSPAFWALQPQCCRDKEDCYVYRRNFNW